MPDPRNIRIRFWHRNNPFLFIVLILALSQLLIDLTIISTFVTPVAWGVGLGLGAGIAIFIGFGLKDRAPEIMDKMMKKISK